MVWCDDVNVSSIFVDCYNAFLKPHGHVIM